MSYSAPYKQEAYEQAIAFRRRGFTYTEIAKICNVSRGTVSNWLAHEPFSQQIAKENAQKAIATNKKRLALINKARVSERKDQSLRMLKTAEIEYKNYRSSPLFIAGVTLYMAKGNHSDTPIVRLSTSEAEHHRLFIDFVKNYLGAEKEQIRFWLLLYRDHDEVACMKYWSKKTGISVGRFHKNQFIAGKKARSRLQFGVGNTIIGSTLLQKKLKKWMELLKKECQHP